MYFEITGTNINIILNRVVHTNKNIPYYLTAVGLFILLKFGFTLATIENLTFLLKPTDKLIEFITNSQSVFLAAIGYYHEKLNILIDKSCSGFNFWILCFLMFTYLIEKYFDNPLHKILTIPAALIFAYLLTIFANTSRIYASIVVQNQTRHFLPLQQHLVHESIGITTNLIFLILAYCLIDNLLIHRIHNEKFA